MFRPRAASGSSCDCVFKWVDDRATAVAGVVIDSGYEARLLLNQELVTIVFIGLRSLNCLLLHLGVECAQIKNNGFKAT